LEGFILARVTIEDCLKNVDNRFALVHLAAKRVRQIREGADLLVKSSKNGDVVTVLREIAANRIVAKKKKKPDTE
jgi:DNA-directed RNA polymerase subunit omega